MSVNSLANFGVPGLNGDRSAVLQPILTTHWRLLTYNFGAASEPAPYDMTRQAKKVTLPGVTFEMSTLYSYVSAVYIMTRGEWGEGSMSFVDDITNSVRRRIENQIAKQKNFFDQTMSRAGENYKFEMDVDVLAGGATAGGSAADPNILRKYCYAGCTLVSVEDGEMSYETASPKEITVKFRYDNCITFDQNGSRMGTFSHTEEIQSQSGSLSTGAGAPGGLGISISGNSITVTSSGVSLGGATLNGGISFGGGA
jgi:hypothetical protein